MNKKEILVSVCMITYNHDNYIKEAIEGVLMQKINFPIELIIGEDCSTDNTRKIVLEYADKYPNIIRPLLPEKNLGMTINFIKTMQEATGKYIALCEGDDYWTDPYKLQKQVDFLEANQEYGFIGSKCKILNMKGDIEDDKTYLPESTSINSISLYGNIFDYAKYGPVTRTVTLVFKKVLISNDLDYIVGDYTLQAILAKRSKFACLTEVCCVYRKNNGGVSQSIDLNGQLNYAKWYRDNRKMLNHLFPDECNFDEKELNDNMTYKLMKNSILNFNFERALFLKSQLQSNTYRNKKFSLYFT